MNPKNKNHPEFASDFESGNLDLVLNYEPNKYELYMRADSNSIGHRQWYFFKVKFKNKGLYNFTICNFSKKDSLYTKGMKPYVFSK
jgi:hypothetical protein